MDEEEEEATESVDLRPMGRRSMRMGSTSTSASTRRGVAPRITPSFRVERMRRARCVASKLLLVSGGRQRMAPVTSMTECAVSNQDKTMCVYGMMKKRVTVCEMYAVRTATCGVLHDR